jgi:hypothetical protein
MDVEFRDVRMGRERNALGLGTIERGGGGWERVRWRVRDAEIVGISYTQFENPRLEDQYTDRPEAEIDFRDLARFVQGMSRS